ncbi:MAG: baseplate J/gp47 family protein [Butyricicoccus sp.]
MFENYTFETLMEKTLANVSDTVDKREGSIIYDAIAPAIIELSNAYMMLDMVVDEVFADTASYYYLIKRAAERGMYPEEETYTIGKMVVSPPNANVSVGDRFALGELIFAVLSGLDGEDGSYEVRCETAGVAGNQQIGTLLPVEYIEGLQTAELTEILIPGEEEEDVEAFRERYLTSFDSVAFGGNKADYMSKVNAIDGVGGCRLIREWENGFSPANFIPPDAAEDWIASLENVDETIMTWLTAVHAAAKDMLFTVGGTVKVIIIASDYSAPSDLLVQSVQQAIDPVETAGEGDGTAPIGHVVHVIGVQDFPIDFSFDFVFARGYTFDDVKESVVTVIDQYLLQLRQTWDSAAIIVRTNQLETNLLTIDGIADITETRMNGDTGNLTMDAEYIPVRGEVSG